MNKGGIKNPVPPHWQGESAEGRGRSTQTKPSTRTQALWSLVYLQRFRRARRLLGIQQKLRKFNARGIKLLVSLQ